MPTLVWFMRKRRSYCCFRDAFRRLHHIPSTRPYACDLPDELLPPADVALLCYPNDEDYVQVWNEAIIVVMEEVPRVSTPHVDGVRWEHVRDMNASVLHA
jgi:hypothetical protein